MTGYQETHQMREYLICQRKNIRNPSKIVGTKTSTLSLIKLTEVTKNENENVISYGLTPPYSQEVATNVGKKFLQLLDLHFPRSSNLRKIFNRNTVRVSYSCTKNIGRIIKSHNHKLLNPADENPFPCNCKNKAECPLEGKCKAQSIVYKCVVSAANHQDKVYLGTSEGEFKQRYYNHKKSFNNKRYWKDTTLSKYIWDLKEKSNVTPTLKWSNIGKIQL